MATTSTIKRHDTKLVFTDVPTIDGVPLVAGDLVGCTVSFLLKDTAGVIPPIKQTATITGATFSYSPVPSDVANSGKFEQEWEVVYPSAKILTFPNDKYNIVKI